VVGGSVVGGRDVGCNVVGGAVVGGKVVGGSVVGGCDYGIKISTKVRSYNYSLRTEVLIQTFSMISRCYLDIRFVVR